MKEEEEEEGAKPRHATGFTTDTSHTLDFSHRRGNQQLILTF